MQRHQASAAVRAFTLVELLVVIAIIGLLAAMLLSALTRAKQQAWSTRCKSNLRQMEIALRLYVDDDGGKYPYAQIFTDHYSYWVDAIAPYYRVNWTNQAYHCPGYKGLISVDPPGIRGTNGSPVLYYVGSYGYNGYGTQYGNGLFLGLGGMSTFTFPSFPSLHDSQVSAPSEMIALADTDLWAVGNTPVDQQYAVAGFLPWGSYWLQTPPWLDQGSGAYPPRHGKNYNFTCTDGHVEAMAPARLFSPQASSARWNWDHQPHPETWR